MEEDLLNIRDFENCKNITQTYSGHERDLIDVLKEDLESIDLEENKKEAKTEEFDPNDLLDHNFKAYK